MAYQGRKYSCKKRKKRKNREKGEKWAKGLTMARFLFKLRNTLCFLIELRSAISVGSSRAYSTMLATYLALPCWKSLIKASKRSFI